MVKEHVGAKELKTPKKIENRNRPCPDNNRSSCWDSLMIIMLGNHHHGGATGKSREFWLLLLIGLLIGFVCAAPLEDSRQQQIQANDKSVLDFFMQNSKTLSGGDTSTLTFPIFSENHHSHHSNGTWRTVEGFFPTFNEQATKIQKPNRISTSLDEHNILKYTTEHLFMENDFGELIRKFISSRDNEEKLTVDPNTIVNRSDYIDDPNDQSDIFDEKVHIRGVLKMDLAFRKTILREYYFVYGAVTMRNGRYFLQRENLLFLEGVYSIFTNRFYFILKPKKFLFYRMPVMLEKNLMNETYLFHGETGAELAYYSYVDHYMQELKDLGIRYDSYYYYNSASGGQGEVNEKTVSKKESCVYRGLAVGAPSKTGSSKKKRDLNIFEWKIAGIINSVNCDHTAIFDQTFHDNSAFTTELNTFLQIGTVLCIVLVFGLFRQIKSTRTRSTAHRVSILFVGFTSTLAFITFSASLVFLLNFYEVFNSAIALSFMSFIYLTCSIQYMLFVWKSHYPSHYDNVNTASVHMRKLFFFFWGFSMTVLFGG